jgi:hypothetical protein
MKNPKKNKTEKRIPFSIIFPMKFVPLSFTVIFKFSDEIYVKKKL